MRRKSVGFCGASSCELVLQERINSLRTACIDCPKNTFSLGLTDTCTPCDENQISPSVRLNAIIATQVGVCKDSYDCKSCKPGQRFIQMNIVLLASQGSLQSTQVRHCKPCAAGKYSNANATRCLQCPQGHYCQHAAREPVKCVAKSRYCPSGTSAPIIAAAGSYTNIERTGVLLCEPGSYCINGEKIPCPAIVLEHLQACSVATAHALPKSMGYNKSSISCSCIPRLKIEEVVMI